MALIGEPDLVRAIGQALVLQLCDDSKSGAADADVVEQLCADAEAEVMGYATRVHSVATLMANPPATLKRLCVDCAVQMAYLRRPEFLNDKGETPWETRYKAAVARLKEIGEGKFRLDIDDSPERPANVKGGGVRTGVVGLSAVDQSFIRGGTGSGGF